MRPLRRLSNASPGNSKAPRRDRKIPTPGTLSPSSPGSRHVSEAGTVTENRQVPKQCEADGVNSPPCSADTPLLLKRKIRESRSLKGRVDSHFHARKEVAA